MGRRSGGAVAVPDAKESWRLHGQHGRRYRTHLNLHRLNKQECMRQHGPQRALYTIRNVDMYIAALVTATAI
jgi:hypothetical protein